jgi:hypothetical protein
MNIGDEIYVDSSCSLSSGSTDVIGGLAKVTKVINGISGGEPCLFIEVAELPGHQYNWDQVLSKKQEELKNKFGEHRAFPDPDIDRPWIEDGDFANGEIYHGCPIL